MKEKFLQVFDLEKIILRLAAAWCISSEVLLGLSGVAFPDISAYADMSIVSIGLMIIGIFGLLSVFATLLPEKADFYVLLPAFGCYTVVVMLCQRKLYFAFALTAVWALLLWYYSKRGMLTAKHFGNRLTVTCIAVTAVCFTAFVSAVCILRYLTFTSPNFDFTIFCQAYYYLKEELLPLSTCERDTLLSHFAVHASPVLYLLLPVYALFPYPCTLQVAQAVVLASAVIPVCLIAKKYDIKGPRLALIAVITLFAPAVINGANYDFHENCFLYPLLCWVFLFLEKERYAHLAVFTLLTLGVKEDAAVYIIFLGLYVIFGKKKRLTGIALALGAGIYFIAVLALLSKYGQGVMSGRYANYIVGDGGLLEAIKTVLASPAYVFSQVFVDGDGNWANKLLYFIEMSLPLCFMPFMVKGKTPALILLLPLLLVNLMTTYKYQFDINFQYSFGSAAFLLYLSVLNLTDIERETGKFLLCTACVSCIMCTLGSAADKLNTYAVDYIENRQAIALMDKAVKSVPEDSVVIASSKLTAHMCNRKSLYEDVYHDNENGERADYVLLDMRSGEVDMLDKYLELGYEITSVVRSGDKRLIVILQ